MLRPAARLALAAAAPSSARSWRVRYISTPAVVTLGHHAKALDRNVYLFHRELLNHTNDPFWILQSRLRSPHKLLTHRNAARFLSPTGMGRDEFKERWSPLLYSANIEAAIDMLQKADFNIPTLLPSNEDSSAMAVANPVPSWLTFFLAAHKVRTPEHAAGPLMQLVYSQLPATVTHYQPHLLVFAVLALSTFGVRMHVADIIRRFLLMPVTDPRLLFNLLLMALARQDGSKELASSVVNILQAMRSRQITLTPHTYELLLADRFVTTELTKVLRAQMLHEGFVSDQKHLEAYLRIYAEDGAIHNMKQYRTAIRAQAIRRGGHSGQPQDVMIADSQALSALSMKDRGSAFHFLAHLVASNTPTSANSTETDSPPSTPVPNHPPQRLPNRARLRPIRRSITSRSHKTIIPDIYEWTSALAAASRDMSTSSEQLIKLLQYILDTHKLVPTVATYTVVLRGLIYRRDLELALEVWKIFRASGLKLDDRALVVGLQVLTRAGKPHLAFELLERYAAWPQLSSDTTVQMTTSDAEASKAKPQRKVILSTIGMNEFMVSLQRIGRPDLVFFLWDHMYTLYGVTPNVVTLSILLKSAHLAAKLDDSLQGMWNSFRQRKVDASAPPRSRDDITNMLKDLVGNVDIGLVPYSSGRWRGRAAWVHAADIFKQVVFHAKPELRHTNPSQLPAHALRLSSDQLATSPFATLLRASLASIVPGISSFADTTTGFTATTTTDTTTHIVRGLPILPTHALANMTPTEPCFKQFLQLVAIHDTPAHIPTILSWMRTLDVRPTRTTIALVVILWGEVASHAPIVEHYYSARKKRDAVDAAANDSLSSSASTESSSSASSPSPADERSQFFRLQAWLKKWLGESFPTPSKTQYHQAFKLICGLRSPVSRASGEVMDPRKNKFLTEEKLAMFRRLRFATAKRKRRARKRVMRMARTAKDEDERVRGYRRVGNGKSGKMVKAMVGKKKARISREGDRASALGSGAIGLDSDTP